MEVSELERANEDDSQEDLMMSVSPILMIANLTEGNERKIAFQIGFKMVIVNDDKFRDVSSSRTAG